ncbi:signal recognition particle-docking protein FtsY [Salinicola sp. MIT1003]|uniref:signal recognition particle-docking protein FtsY n=1 Tax=Salinicola sp. MIT1003 TaxID=1882734 RepID=UPI0008DD5C1B|nr:signal recognition particle-docking protein FtsY [Salinicola sp. MIT1003]OHZ01250.1 signal recognition particle-docking protein FtsY [Salinicola sp. MIT1003]
MFGLFKSRKKQQQEEEARRREAEEAEARAAAERGEEEPGDDTPSDEPKPAVEQGDETPAEANSGRGDAPAEPERASVSGTVTPDEPSVQAEDPERPATVDYEPSSLEETAAREALSEPLSQESPQSALQEDQAEGTRATDLARDVTPAPEPASMPEPEPEPEPEPPAAVSPVSAPAPKEKPKGGWLARVRAGLGRTRANLTDGIADLLLGKKQIDDELMEDLETQLLLADVGIEATTEIIERLTGRVSRKELADADALYRALQEELAALLEPVSQPLQLPPKGEGPFVILMVGVNGVGKTTTIGKLTQRFQNEGRSVMLAAGDTFRAAAVEQLKVWGDRNRVPVIAQHTGADSASVIYDAVAAARARKVDVLIADTAGRLHNKSHLMEELKKVQRVMAKLDASAPHEVMLVLDAGTGQNAISQATTFDEAIPITGITLTKLDGTAKGGIIFALAKKMGTPIRFIGVGESLEDLRPFDAQTFVKALFGRDGDADS